MSDLFAEPDDATPLTPEERDGLLQSWITHRSDLNAAERDNILAGAVWARARRSRRPADLITDGFVRSLHRRMFGEVWKWAGSYRLTERNIGLPPHRIAAELALLLDDARYWLGHGTYEPDELAIRLHHRLVAIHPFPNGNGRHARLMADLLITRLGSPAFSWGGGRLADPGAVRRRYIDALKAADGHDVLPLIKFARS